MYVIPIAHTITSWHRIADLGFIIDKGVQDADALAEFAGRTCYLSYDRPNPDTATNEQYLANIIDKQHYSVLEHSSITFYIENVSRSLLAELTRHRHLSFSVMSQRYVDQSENDIQPTYPPIFDDELVEELGKWFDLSVEQYKATYKRLADQGYSRKAARGAARAFLPESTETRLVVTGNLRAWREVLAKRNSAAADQEIRNLAEKILAWCKIIAPNSFQDM